MVLRSISFIQLFEIIELCLNRLLVRSDLFLQLFESFSDIKFEFFKGVLLILHQLHMFLTIMGSMESSCDDEEITFFFA